MRYRAFLRSVILPLAALLGALVLIAGCETSPSVQPPAPCPYRAKIVAFTATWCVPCQKAKLRLLELQATGVEVQIVDIDIHPELARRYNVGAVPMFIVSVSGEPVVRTNNIDVVVAMLLRVHH